MKSTEKKGVGKGCLEVVCGSMFSGKTEELMRRLRRAEYAKQKVLTMKHHIDKRYNKQPACIVSHEGRERFAFLVNEGDVGIQRILELSNNEVDVIGIDEVQFFEPSIIDIINLLVERGKRVIVAGLDLDFRGVPFPIVSRLLSVADEILKLKAICVACGKEAYHSQRIIDGRPASYHDPVILVGASEFYEARCRDCFVIGKPESDHTAVVTQSSSPQLASKTA